MVILTRGTVGLLWKLATCYSGSLYYYYYCQWLLGICELKVWPLTLCLWKSLGDSGTFLFLMPYFLNFIIPGFRVGSDRSGHGLTARKSLGDHLRQPESTLLSPVLFPKQSTPIDFSNCLFFWVEICSHENNTLVVNAKSNEWVPYLE